MNAAEIECPKVVWRVASVEQNSSDQEPRQNKKKIHATPPQPEEILKSIEKAPKITAPTVRNVVKQEDEKNCQTPQAVQLWDASLHRVDVFVWSH
jgi:hypothetical protein